MIWEKTAELKARHGEGSTPSQINCESDPFMMKCGNLLPLRFWSQLQMDVPEETDILHDLRRGYEAGFISETAVSEAGESLSLNTYSV